MKEFSYTITDPLGIHARPAGLLVKKSQGFESSITISRGNDTSDGKKVLALMKLRVKQGETITVKAEGADEIDAVTTIGEFLQESL